jgi:hypothetical protein
MSCGVNRRSLLIDMFGRPGRHWSRVLPGLIFLVRDAARSLLAAARHARTRAGRAVAEAISARGAARCARTRARPTLNDRLEQSVAS